MRYNNSLGSGILVFFLLFSVSNLRSQEAIDPLNSDISQSLLPLNALIDSALLHDPYVRFRDLQLIVNKAKLKADKSQWARNFGIQTDIRHGTFDNFSTNTSEGQVPSLFATRSNQTNYGVGAYIKFPIYDLLNRKNQINLARTELEQAKSMADMQRNEVKQLVIKQYNELILKHRLLKIRTKTLETAKINYFMVEKEFQNGVVDVTEFSRISENTARADSDFETARIEFITAYLILEEIVGFKFNITQLQ
jgi:outer membrane protein TolC